MQGCSLTTAAEKVNEKVQSTLATLPNIKQLKSQQEECLARFTAGNDVVALLSTGFFIAHAISGKLHSVASFTV